MFENEVKIRRISAKITSEEEQRIKDFVQGAVYSFCNNSKNENFAARDLFGGDNRNWSKTPLQILFNWHFNNHQNDAYDMAAKDIGWILLDVLNSDDKKFIKHDEYVNSYEYIYNLG